MTATPIDESRVYSSYRRTLKSLKSGGRDSRAGARKQEARKRTADKYGIPISKVKDIVREQDAEHGITHEHPEAYLRQLERDQIRAEWNEAFTSQTVCAGCGRTHADMYAFLTDLKPGAERLLDGVRLLRVVFDGQEPRWTCMECTPWR